jgi:uncharacterized membrane protein HdeD (DUF308 family)
MATPITVRSSWHMSSAETVWTRIIGVLLILLGLALFASQPISYTKREEIKNTPLTVKREKFFVMQRPVGVLIIGVGLLALFFAGRSTKSQP